MCFIAVGIPSYRIYFLYSFNINSPEVNFSSTIHFFIHSRTTLLFYQIEPLKNGASLILPSSIARNWLAPNAKRIFEILWGIPEGRTNTARPSRPCLKNCQNGTFWPVHGIWNFFGPNDFIWGAIKVPFFDFIQKMTQAPSIYFRG